jgi:hypothetical protein
VKVLYIAGTPDESKPLLEVAEVTELALLFRGAGGRGHEFLSLPDIAVHQIRDVVTQFKPDVVHLAAHGDGGILRIRNSAGKPAAVTEEILKSFLEGLEIALVYLNACDSSNLARGVVGSIPAAVGFEGKVSNAIARQAAVMFYKEILSGASLLEAHRLSSGYVAATTSALGCRSVLEGIESARNRRLCVPLILVARIAGLIEDGRRRMQVGVHGVMQRPTQVLICLCEQELEEGILRSADFDDEDREIGLAGALCRVIVLPKDHGTIWSNAKFLVRHDCVAIAVLTLLDGTVLTVSCLLTKALVYYGEKFASAITDAERTAIQEFIQLQ